MADGGWRAFSLGDGEKERTNESTRKTVFDGHCDGSGGHEREGTGPTTGRRQAAGRIGTGNWRMGAIVALVAGLIAVVNGGLNLAIAKGGPGTGNGVVGGAAALVLGLIAMALGGLALARSRRTRSGVTSPSRHE